MPGKARSVVGDQDRARLRYGRSSLRADPGDVGATSLGIAVQTCNRLVTTAQADLFRGGAVTAEVDDLDAGLLRQSAKLAPGVVGAERGHEHDLCGVAHPLGCQGGGEGCASGTVYCALFFDDGNWGVGAQPLYAPEDVAVQKRVAHDDDTGALGGAVRAGRRRRAHGRLARLST